MAAVASEVESRTSTTGGENNLIRRAEKSRGHVLLSITNKAFTKNISKGFFVICVT